MGCRTLKILILERRAAVQWDAVFDRRSFFLGSIGTRSAFDAMVTRIRSAIEPPVWERGFQKGRSAPFERIFDWAALALSQQVRR